MGEPPSSPRPWWHFLVILGPGVEIVLVAWKASSWARTLGVQGELPELSIMLSNLALAAAACPCPGFLVGALPFGPNWHSHFLRLSFRFCKSGGGVRRLQLAPIILNLLLATETLLKRTTSRCPQCHQACPAEVWQIGTPEHSRVFLRRTCPEHGEAEACISSDARFYWLAQGDPQNACCGGNACSASDGVVRGTLGRNAPRPNRRTARASSFSTCLALIEIVHSCNLACPTCYADSPQQHARRCHSAGRVAAAHPGRDRPQRAASRFCNFPAASRPCIRNFSSCSRGARAPRASITCCSIRTACASPLMMRFSTARARPSATANFSSTCNSMDRRRPASASCAAPTCARSGAGDRALRGAEHSHHAGHDGDAGESSASLGGGGVRPAFPARARRRLSAGLWHGRHSATRADAALNTADIILAAVEQSGGRLRYEDFTPLPCGDPNCATIGYLLKTAGRRHALDQRIHRLRAGAGISARQDPLPAGRPAAVRVRERTARRVAERIRTR